MACVEQRQLKLTNPAYRSKRWRLTEAGSVISLFERIKREAVRRSDQHSVSWYRGKSVGHLENRENLYDSPLLGKLGLTVVEVYVEVTVCHDMILLVDQSVTASNGEVFSRGECRARDLRRYPTPDIIAELRDTIRKDRPRTDYMDLWTGTDSSGIQEINMTEIFDAGIE